MTPAFSDRLATVQAQITEAAQASGRDSSAIRVVAVTKTARDTDLVAACEVGQSLFAHNHVQALERQHAVIPDADWRLIGPLQRNKARRAVSMVSCIETVASQRLADTLDRLAAELRSSPLPILVQVNLNPEDGRAGVDAAGLPRLLEQLQGASHLQVDGIMSVAAAGADESALHQHFARVRGLSEASAEAGLLPREPELSMGMSNDFRIAIAEGATLVRIGRALFPTDPS